MLKARIETVELTGIIINSETNTEIKSFTTSDEYLTEAKVRGYLDNCWFSPDDVKSLNSQKFIAEKTTNKDYDKLCKIQDALFGFYDSEIDYMRDIQHDRGEYEILTELSEVWDLFVKSGEFCPIYEIGMNISLSDGSLWEILDIRESDRFICGEVCDIKPLFRWHNGMECIANNQEFITITTDQVYGIVLELPTDDSVKQLDLFENITEETTMINTEIKTEETTIATNEELQEIEQYKAEVIANRPVVLPWKHTDFKTAYIIEDYPYGRTLRCKKAVWLETATKGSQRGKMRSCYQTTNPKHKKESWNAVKPSQYTDLKFLYIDPKTGYLEEMGLSTYSPDEIARWKALWYPLLDSEQQKAVDNLEKVSIALNAMWKNVTFETKVLDPCNAFSDEETPIAEVTESEQTTEVTKDQPISETQPEIDLNKLLSDISNLSDGTIASCLSKTGHKCNDKTQIEKIREELFDWTAINFKESDRWQDAWNKFAELFDFTEIIKSVIEWEIRFVCASEDYDNFDTHTIELLPYKEKNGKQFRKVAINPHNLNYQTSRYFSGNCRPHTADEFETLKGILISIESETSTSDTVAEIELIATPEIDEAPIAPIETTDSENWEEIDNKWDHTPTIEVTEETEETVADLLADVGLGTDTLESAGIAIEIKSEDIAIAPITPTEETISEIVEPIATTNLIQFPIKETETAKPTEVEPATIEAVTEVNPIANPPKQKKVISWTRVNTAEMALALSNNETIQRLYAAVKKSDPTLASKLFVEETLEIVDTPTPTEKSEVKETPIAVAEVPATKPEIVAHTPVNGTTQAIKQPKPQRQKTDTSKPARQPKAKTSDSLTPAQKLEEMRQLKKEVDAKGKKVVAEEKGYSDTSTINANLIGLSVLEQSEDVKQWFLNGQITWSDVRETRKQINKIGLLGVIEQLHQKVQKAS